MYRGVMFFFALAALTSCGAVNSAKVQPVMNIAKKASVKTQNGIQLDINDLIDELNYARSNPKQYAKIIKATLPNYRDGMYYDPETHQLFASKEGPSAALEAIDFLNKIPNSPPVSYMNALCLSATDHVNDLGPKGVFGHSGSDGSSPLNRISRYGDFPGEGHVGESIAFGYKTPRSIIVALLVDDGVKDRGHRRSIMNPKYTNIGVAYGYHKKYGFMCVMDFSKGYIEKINNPIAVK